MRALIPLSLLAITTVGVNPMFAAQIGFNTNLLASDIPGLAAVTDPGLINPWGLSASGGSPLWISVNGSGTSELYNGAGVKQGLVVSNVGAGPTGTVFNGAAGAFNGDVFLFASEDGAISGWRGSLGTVAETLVNASTNNVYKGLAIGTVGTNTYAYAANFRTGNIDVLKGSVGEPNLPGTFIDPSLPAGYAPFDVQNLGGVVYVTYALQNGAKHDDVAGAGHGFVAMFDQSGNFLGQIISAGLLNSPWGLAIAPAGFGDVAGDLLVGNFGDGRINAYNATTGVFIETLQDAGGNPITLDGLWALRFGNGGNGGPTTNLYFTAGINKEADGLFGDLATVPEPGTWALVGIGVTGLLLRKLRASR